MKKLWSVILLATVALVACSKGETTISENNDPQDSPETTIDPDDGIPEGYHLVSLTAVQGLSDGEDTKTSYANDKIFSWSSGDAIAVLFNNGVDEKFFEFTTTGTGASATFTGLVEDGYNYEGSKSGTKWALFPYNANHKYTSDTDIQYAFPAGGNGNVCNIPMIAQCPSSEYRFYHLCGALKFTFRGLSANQNLKLQFNSRNDNRRTYGVYYIQGLGSGVSSAIIQGNHIDKDSNHNANNTTYVTAQADANGKAVIYLPLPLSETGTMASEYWPSYQFDLLNAANDASLFSITTGHFNIDKGKMTVITPKQLGTEPLGGISIDGTFTDWETHTERYLGGTLGFVKATADRTNLYIYQRFFNSNFTYSNWDNYQFIYIDTDNNNATGCTVSDAHKKGAERRWKFFTYFDDPSCPYKYKPDESKPFAEWVESEATKEEDKWSVLSLSGFDASTMYKTVKSDDYLDIEYCIPLASLGITVDPSSTKDFAIGLEGHYKDGAATPATVYPKTRRLTITIPAPSE